MRYLTLMFLVFLTGCAATQQQKLSAIQLLSKMPAPNVRHIQPMHRR